MKVRGESQEEAFDPTESLASPKQTLRIGSWNIRTMFETSRIHQVIQEMKHYRLNILGVSEVRWTDSGKFVAPSGETMCYSGRKDGQHMAGVGIIMDKDASKCLMEWEPINSRIIRVRLFSKFSKCTIIQCYAPTEQASDEVKEEFYNCLNEQLFKVPHHDVLIVQGDMNAKIGSNNKGYERCMGRHGLGQVNDNGERFLDLCLEHSLAIGGSLFQHKDIHKATWNSPDGKTRNQIDHVAINQKWRKSLKDVKVIRAADVDSDHHLVLCKFKLKLKKWKRNNTPKLFNSSKLRDTLTRETFSTELSNNFHALSSGDSVDDRKDIDNHCKTVESVFVDTSHKILGFQERYRKPWISNYSWELIGERKKLKQRMLSCKTRSKEIITKEYVDKCKEVKRSTRTDKRKYLEDKASEAQNAAIRNDSRTLYKISRELCGTRMKSATTVKDKEGKNISKEEDQLKRWAEHFRTILNRPAPDESVEFETSFEEMEIKKGPITREEIEKAIMEAKSNKAPGEDRITADMLKANPQTSAECLVDLFNRVWTEEKVPTAWKRGIIVKIPKKGDLTDCGNWRGINLLSVPGKIFCRVVLHRIKNSLEKNLREEQAGFRSGRSCTDQIFVLRTIIEQSKEWNTSLYINFMDFEKAFDSVHHESLWKILKSYGFPSKITNILSDMYSDNQCCVRHGNEHSEWFHVKSGVRQGCIISPFLFLLVIDWVMKQATKDRPHGIPWDWMKRLEDVDFADDIALLAHTHKDMQDKSKKVEEAANKVGLRINLSKTKVMKLNAKTNKRVKINNKDLDEVEDFKYLGSIVTPENDMLKEITARIALAASAFQKMNNIWKSKNYSTSTKLKLYQSNVRSILLYAAETWRINKKIESKLRGFEGRCLRRLMQIHWEERISNKELAERTGIKHITEEIKRRRWRWLGHVLRMNKKRHPHTALNWTPQGTRKRGRPTGTWRRTIEEERRDTGKTWHELKWMAQDRGAWRCFVDALCSPKEP